MQGLTRIRVIRAVSIASSVSAIAVLCVWVGLLGCSSSCTEKVKSAQEAKAALAVFFSSKTRAANNLVESLRKDGMTDEYFAKLQKGCIPCYAYLGKDRDENPDNWHVATSIAPEEQKKMVVLEIECANSVLLIQRLYGG